MTENIDFVKSQTRITAHSGADQTVDNSLESIHYVLQTEADAFEVDVRRNAHGLLTLGHDEAGEDALLLSTVFEMMQHTTSNPNMKINCDLKEDGLE